MRIGEIIRERRVTLGMTQTELARRLGISRNQVSNLETGKSDPSSKVFGALEEALETSFTELLTDAVSSPVVWLCRHEDGRSTGSRRRGIEERELASGPGQRLTPVRVRLAPRGRWEAGRHMTQCSEHFVYVLQGSAEGMVDGRWFTLEEHHAVYVHGNQPLVWRNSGVETCEFLWIGGE